MAYKSNFDQSMILCEHPHVQNHRYQVIELCTRSLDYATNNVKNEL